MRGGLPGALEWTVAAVRVDAPRDEVAVRDGDAASMRRHWMFARAGPTCRTCPWSGVWLAVCVAVPASAFEAARAMSWVGVGRVSVLASMPSGSKRAFGPSGIGDSKAFERIQCQECVRPVAHRAACAGCGEVVGTRMSAQH